MLSGIRRSTGNNSYKSDDVIAFSFLLTDVQAEFVGKVSHLVLVEVLGNAADAMAQGLVGLLECFVDFSPLLHIGFTQTSDWRSVFSIERLLTVKKMVIEIDINYNKCQGFLKILTVCRTA